MDGSSGPVAGESAAPGGRWGCYLKQGEVTIYDAPESMGGQPERWVTSARVGREVMEMCRAIAASLLLLIGLCSYTWSNTAARTHVFSDRPHAGHPRAPLPSQERTGTRRLGAPQRVTTASYQLLLAGNPVSTPRETGPGETQVVQTPAR